MTNDILQTLHNSHTPLTINELASRLGTGWRTVAKEVNRLYHEGKLYADGDKQVGDNMYPRWRLTSAGELAAAEARAAQRMEEASDDDEA